MFFDIDKFAEELQEEIMQDVRRKYTPVVVEHWMQPANFKRMKDYDGHGKVDGICGDTQEIFIRVEDGKISDCSFYTNGCGTTIACGSLVVSLAKGKFLTQATQINEKAILDASGGLPEEDKHCAELAANALQYAIIDYETASIDSGKEKEGK